LCLGKKSNHKFNKLIMTKTILFSIKADELKSMIEESVSSAIKNHQKSLQASQERKEILTVEEVCDILCVTKSAIYEMIQRKLIPHSKPKGLKRVFFFRSDIENHIYQGKQKTLVELIAEQPKHIRALYGL
jgi:excisionase family DNA binding protein